MERYKNKYRIESTRLKGWDYANPGFYFVTLCIKNRECVLGKIVKAQCTVSNMILSPAGEIVQSEWMKTPEIRKNVRLDAFQVMPDHLHGIIIITHRIEYPQNGDGNDKNKGNTGGLDGSHGLDGLDGLRVVETRCTVSLQHATSQPTSQTCQILRPEQYIRMGFSRTYKNKFGPQKNNLSSIIGGYKSATTVNIRVFRDFQWQSLFDDHVIRNTGELNRIRHYIKNNPANWNTDDKNLIPGM